MFELRKLDGTTERVGFSYLESLRMLMDWQLRAKGYDPASVNEALNVLDIIFGERARSKNDNP